MIDLIHAQDRQNLKIHKLGAGDRFLGQAGDRSKVAEGDIGAVVFPVPVSAFLRRNGERWGGKKGQRGQ